MNVDNIRLDAERSQSIYCLRLLARPLQECPMQLRNAHDLAPVIQEARRGVGWSQSRLADVVGVSRQWISLVETGKTSVEFDLVLSLLHTLGYRVCLERADRDGLSPVVDRGPGRLPTHDPSSRTPLTKRGKPLGHQRSRRDR